jgi:hypothetical protein
MCPDTEREMISRWDRVFRALSAEPRRQIVAALLEAPPERDLPLPEAANPPYLRTDPETLYLELRHCHLPLLAESGFVRWKEEPPCVSRGEAFEEVAVVVEALYDDVEAIPDQLREGCQRLEQRA